MDKRNKKDQLKIFLNNWIDNKRDLSYLKDRDHEDFSELIGLAKVLEMYNIDITSDTDVITTNGQRPDFIVNTKIPKLYIEVTRAGHGNTTSAIYDELLKNFKNFSTKEKVNLDDLVDDEYLFDNTKIENEDRNQCMILLYPRLINIFLNKKLNNIDHIDKFRKIKCVVDFINEQLKGKKQITQELSDLIKLCSTLLNIQLTNITNDDNSISIPLRLKFINKLKPIIYQFFNQKVVDMSNKLPLEITSYINTEVIDDTYYTMISSVTENILRAINKSLGSLIPKEFYQKYANANQDYFHDNTPEQNDIVHIFEVIKDKFKKYNSENHDGKGILVIKLEPHVFGIFNTKCEDNSDEFDNYIQNITKLLATLYSCGAYFSEILLISHAYKDEPVCLQKSPNNSWTVKVSNN